jgi:hypothetical protein
MPSRLSPNAASEAAEAFARKEAATRREAAASASKLRSKNRRLGRLWESQRDKLIAAALNGDDCYLSLDSPVVFPGTLLDLGLMLLNSPRSVATEEREDSVMARLSRQEKSLRSTLAREVPDWIRAARHIDKELRPHAARLEQQLFQFLIGKSKEDIEHESFILLEEIQSAPFDHLALLSSEVTSEMEFYPETARIESTFRAYAAAVHQEASAKADYEARRSTPSTPVLDSEAEILEAPAKVVWKRVIGRAAWPDTDLLSCESLSWICGSNGQTLLQEVESEIGRSAKLGSRSIELVHNSAQGSAHVLRVERVPKPLLAPPALVFVEMLQLLGWDTELTDRSAEACGLRISW